MATVPQAQAREHVVRACVRPPAALGQAPEVVPLKQAACSCRAWATWERANGVPGQDSAVRRLREQLHLDGGRTGVFRRQGFSQRTKTVPRLQSQARGPGTSTGSATGTGRDHRDLRLLRARNDGAVQAYARAAGSLPLVLPAEESPRGGLVKFPSRPPRPTPGAVRLRRCEASPATGRRLHLWFGARFVDACGYSC
jgi:hypothetical protein